MKTKHLILVALLMPFFSINAQEADRWENWKPLIGNWSGEGSGVPGDGTGTFSFTFELEENILVRKRNYVYIGDKQYYWFNDIMIIYMTVGKPIKLGHINLTPDNILNSF